MRDKSLSMWLIVMFGIPGIAVLMLAWLWPVLEAERNMAFFVGSAGLLVALIQTLTLKRSPGRTDKEPIPVKVEAENKA
jgi:uncharacterized membrane protein YhaH (DUF805 family)